MCFDALALKAIKQQFEENKAFVGFDKAAPGSDKTVYYRPETIRRITVEVNLGYGEDNE